MIRHYVEFCHNEHGFMPDNRSVYIIIFLDMWKIREKVYSILTQ